MSINWALIIALVGVIGSAAPLMAIMRKRMAQRRAVQRYADAVQRFAEPIRVPGSQTFAEATSGVPETVNQVADAVGVSLADATRALDEYARAWRESLARDQEERKP